MYRKEGEIPVITKDRYPSRMLVFDTEAYRGDVINGLEIQTFKMAVTRYIEFDKEHKPLLDEAQYFISVEAFAAAIIQYSRKDKPLYVYAHNLKYDLQLSGLLRYLLDGGWKVGTFVFDDPPTFVKLTRNRSTIVLVDTFNYWQTSIEKMGDELKIPKLKMPDNNASIEAWYTYCKRDVDVLTNYLLTFIQFLQEEDLGGLGLTLASQAFRSYRHRFMSHRIILHNRPEATKLERDGYSGGRVEAYYIGQLPEDSYYKLDVNSMYPYVMRDLVYPFEFVSYSEDLPLEQLRRIMDHYYVIANVDIEANNPAYPLKHNHKLIFPTGLYNTTLHHKELIYALKNDVINQIRQVAIYRQAPLFKDYIEYFYDLKVTSEKAGNRVIRQQAKIFMNSLYGKFGQRNVISKITPNVTGTLYGRITGYSEALGCRVEVNCLGQDMEVSYKEGEAAYSFPAIAGAVTANARMYLWRLIEKAGRANVFYCDTDSVITNQTGLDRLSPFMDEHTLGMLKVEGVSNNVYIWGAKDYKFGDEVKHKGVPKSARELQPGVWEYEQFRGAFSWLSDGLDTNVNVYTRIKSRRSGYDKGIVLPDNRVLPVVFRGGG